MGRRCLRRDLNRVPRGLPSELGRLLLHDIALFSFLLTSSTTGVAATAGASLIRPCACLQGSFSFNPSSSVVSDIGITFASVVV